MGDRADARGAPGVLLRHPPELRPGQRLGAYRIEAALGRGGMGEVYLAVDEVLERRVAVKVLSHLDPRAAARFLSEARNHARLDHPNVVPIYGAGCEVVRGAEVRYLVLRFIEGRALFDRVASEGPLSPAETAAVAAQCARGLDHVHRQRFVHRDVKPGNILLDRDGRALVTDFGVARDASASRGETRPGVDFVGTWDYAAPEQLALRPADARSDQYSLGLTALFALTGRHPFGSARAEGQAAPLPERLPERLRAVLARMTAVDPAQRFPSLAAAAAALEASVEPASTRESDDAAADVVRSGPGWGAALVAALGAGVLAAALFGVDVRSGGSAAPAAPQLAAASATTSRAAVADGDRVRVRLADPARALRVWAARAAAGPMDAADVAELRAVLSRLGEVEEALTRDAPPSGASAGGPGGRGGLGGVLPISARRDLGRALDELVRELAPSISAALDARGATSEDGAWRVDRAPVSRLQYYAFLLEVGPAPSAPIAALSPARGAEAAAWVETEDRWPRPRLAGALEPAVGLPRSAVERYAAARGKLLPDQATWRSAVAPLLAEWSGGETADGLWELVDWDGELFLAFLGEGGAVHFAPRERIRHDKAGLRLVRATSPGAPR